ncbi:MAG: putative 4-hydroxybenzoate polyprenyltransferase [bacterium]|nr:putative 4-hydroxybenzoate polyprenyltransferase [bacterium]
MAKVVERIKIILEMIKFEHTIFALPFALLAAFLAARGWPDPLRLLWILVAMVGARSAAMSFNRLVDAPFDARNPRTQDRAIPAGKIKRSEVIVFLLISCLLFFYAAYSLNRLCLLLSPWVLAILLLYSYTKRFTSFAHLILGFCLGLSPLGGWIAISGRFDWLPVVLGLGVLLWVSGFDIIYACLDHDFDQQANLYSIPCRFGIRTGLWISALLHIGAAVFFFLLFPMAGLGLVYLIGYLVTVFFLFYQHWIVRPDDLSRVNLSFFVFNGIISIVLCTAAIIDLLIG